MLRIAICLVMAAALVACGDEHEPLAPNPPAGPRVVFDACGVPSTDPMYCKLDPDAGCTLTGRAGCPL